MQEESAFEVQIRSTHIVYFTETDQINAKQIKQSKNLLY